MSRYESRRDRSRSRDRYRSRSRSRGRRDDRGGRRRSPPRYVPDERRMDKFWDLDKKTLFLSNLPYDSTEDDIRDLREFRDANIVRVGKDRDTGRSRGFAHIEFHSEREADDVYDDIQRYGCKIGSRELFVDFSGAKSKRGRGRGGPGNRGDRRPPPRSRSRTPPRRSRERSYERNGDDRNGHEDRGRDRSGSRGGSRSRSRSR